MKLRYKTLFIYVLKCIAGVLLGYLLSTAFQWIDYSWCLISIILVLSPEGSDAMQLAVTRIKANFVGAATGILFVYLALPNPVNIIAGAVVALVACDALKLNEGAKSTLAALIIILLHHEGAHYWDAAWHRVSAVIAGCITGLLITITFHSVFRIRVTVEEAAGKKPEKEA